MEDRHGTNVIEGSPFSETNLPLDIIFARVNSQPLLIRLIENTLCFGEGPRLWKQDIDRAAFDFMSGILS